MLRDVLGCGDCALSPHFGSAVLCHSNQNLIGLAGGLASDRLSCGEHSHSHSHSSRTESSIHATRRDPLHAFSRQIGGCTRSYIRSAQLDSSIILHTCNKTSSYTRTDLIFWVCMALRNQSEIAQKTFFQVHYSQALLSNYTPLFKTSYERSVFIYCSQFFKTANHGRPLILLKTHVVLVRVACGSNIRRAQLYIFRFPPHSGGFKHTHAHTSSVS